MKRAPFSTQIDLSKFDMKDFAKASDEEKRQQEVMGESTTFFKDGLKRLRKNPLAMGSIIVLVLLILVILLAPKIVPYGYADIVKGAQNLEPFQYSEAEQAQLDAGEKLFPHIFGTDELGRDYFIRVVYGARVSLGVGVFASLLVLIIGIIYGSVSGFCGGKVDMIMMRIVDIIYSLPDMLLIILLAVVLNEVLTPVIKGTVLSKLGVNMIALFIVFGLLYWVGMARLIRGQILTIKQNEYVLAAKVSGAKSSRIIRRHSSPLKAVSTLAFVCFRKLFATFKFISTSSTTRILASGASRVGSFFSAVWRYFWYFWEKSPRGSSLTTCCGMTAENTDPFPGFIAQAKGHLSLFGIFHGIGQKIIDNLTDMNLIAIKNRGHLGIDFHFKIQLLGIRPGLCHIIAVIENREQFVFHRNNFHFSGFDFGNIQNIVDDG